MIPYEQLVSALTSWRQRKGLPTAAADVFGDVIAMPLGALPSAEPELIDAPDDQPHDAMFDEPESTAIAEAYGAEALGAEDIADEAILDEDDAESAEPQH